MALVLIVEDDAQVLVLAESILKSAGYETISADSYPAADALFDQGMRPDVAFVDHNLGEGLTGLDVARTARTHHPEMGVLYTSDDQVITDGLRAMFVDGGEFLAKPYTPEQLVEAINKLAAPGKK